MCMYIEDNISKKKKAVKCQHECHGLGPSCIHVKLEKRKGRDLTQPYDRSPYTDRKIQKAT